MRLVVRLFWIVLTVGVMVLGWQFAAANADNVGISYVFGELTPMPIWLALLLAFAAGIALATLFAFYQMAKLGLVARRYRKSVRGLEAEVHELRSLPLASADADAAEAGEGPGAAPRASRERGG